MSRWAEANKSRCPVVISITRRPGSKGGGKNVLSKKPTPLFLSFWSAILDQRRAFVMYCDIPALQPHVFRLRLYSTEHVLCLSRAFLIAYVCKKRVLEEGGAAERGWRGNGAREDAGGMSGDKKEYGLIWARARRHSDGQGENAPYLLFNYRFIAWPSDRWRHDVYGNTWCGSASITAGERDGGRRAPICLQGITVAHAWARGKVFRAWKLL